MRGLGKVRSVRQHIDTLQIEFRRSLWRRLRRVPRQSSPVFVVGCGRSGTSMLVHQLNKSWQVSLYNEDHPAAFDNFRLRPVSVIDGLVSESNAPLTIFKPILDTNNVPLLLSHFPRGRTIFAFRHFSDVINSSLKRFGLENRLNHVRRWIEEDFSELADGPVPESSKKFIRDRWRSNLTPEEGASLFWLFYNRLYFDLDLHENERVLLVCYERLVVEPQNGFKAITGFLDVKFQALMAAGVFSGSIGRDNEPTFCEELRRDCEALYLRLQSVADRLMSGTKDRTP